MFPTDPHRAIMWYWLGKMRANYDAMRCADESARRGVPALNEHVPDVVLYIQAHPHESSAAGFETLAWDAERPSLASPLWICFHGMTSLYTSEPPCLVPEDQWPALSQQVRQGMQEFFQEQAASK